MVVHRHEAAGAQTCLGGAHVAPSHVQEHGEQKSGG
jgi:hypothetical protein